MKFNMEELQKTSVLRIYLQQNQKMKNLGFWEKIWQNNLGHHLLKKAKQAQIRQALIFTAKSGYLDNQQIQHYVSEIPSHQHPICLEIIDDFEKVHQFINENKNLLIEVKCILLNADSFEMIT